MNWKNFSRNLKYKLRDPMWQFVGVVVAIVGVIIAVWLAPHPPETSAKSSRLRIYAAPGHKNLTDFPNTVAARTRILIDGKEEKDVEYFVYIFDYEGDRPIRAADFELPIQGVVAKNRKILGVRQSFDKNYLQTPMRLDKRGQLQFADEPQIPCEIQQTDQQTVQIKPMLMNSGDWFRVEFYTSALPADENKASASSSPTTEAETALSQDMSWSCRIAGIKCPASEERSELNIATGLESDSSNLLDVSISEYRGWAVYFIVLFTILNLLLMIGLAKQTRVVRISAAQQMILFAVAVFLSMAVAEISADWIFNDHALKSQPIAATVLLSIDVGVLILLALDAVRVNRRNYNSKMKAIHDT